MSKQKYVESTLTLPAEMPLFNYNINFEGLRKILEGVEIKTNRHEDQLQKLQEEVEGKLAAPKLDHTHQQLAQSFLFGVKGQSYIDRTSASQPKSKKMQNLELFCWKMNKTAELVEYLLDIAEKHEEKINKDKNSSEKMIQQSFRRLEDKLTSGMQSFGKSISNYFNETNLQVAQLQSQNTSFQKTTDSKLEDLNRDLARRVSEGTLKASLEAAQVKIQKELQSTLKNDHMLRLASISEAKQSFKEVEKDLQLKNKAVAAKIEALSEKVNKAMQISAFEIEKHKIFQRISELKNKSDELARKNSEFVEFRKNYLSHNEKVKQELIGLQEEVTKMQNKEGSFKKLENMSDVLSSLNPHLVCELGEELKLHTVEIGKLEKRLHDLDSKVQNSGGNEKPLPEVGNGQNSDLIQKILKEYTSNMDFEGRMKRNEKDVMELKKKNDAFIELEKKLYVISKEIDVGAINKELKKKADEENTRKDTKILDGKIEQLFDFYKQLRKEVEEKKRNVTKNDPYENASLTTKRLLSSNCISCAPSTPARRQIAKSRMEMSLDYSLQGQRHTLYSRTGK